MGSTWNHIVFEVIKNGIISKKYKELYSMTFKSVIKILLAIFLIYLTTKQINQSHLDTWYICYFIFYILIVLNWNDKKEKQNN